MIRPKLPKTYRARRRAPPLISSPPRTPGPMGDADDGQLLAAIKARDDEVNGLLR